MYPVPAQVGDAVVDLPISIRTTNIVQNFTIV